MQLESALPKSLHEFSQHSEFRLGLATVCNRKLSFRHRPRIALPFAAAETSHFVAVLTFLPRAR